MTKIERRIYGVEGKKGKGERKILSLFLSLCASYSENSKIHVDGPALADVAISQ